MSKMEHDADAAAHRSSLHTYEKPWYRSGLNVVHSQGFRRLKCLDLCSGNGEFAELLRDRYQMEVTCADYIPLHLKRAADLGFEGFSVNLDDHARAVDVIAETYRGQFDLVVNMAAIEHIFNADNLLRFTHTVLKPGGYLLVNTPNIDFIGYRIYSIFSGNRPFGEGHHVRFWDFRFLRTHLFLNGFKVVGDHRGFFTVPTDPMARAFKNRKLIFGLVARLLSACRVLQNLPYGKGLFSDELTILALKEEAPPIGFELTSVRRVLKEVKDGEGEKEVIARLKLARRRRWLDEHLYLSRLVDSL